MKRNTCDRCGKVLVFGKFFEYYGNKICWDCYNELKKMKRVT